MAPSLTITSLQIKSIAPPFLPIKKVSGAGGYGLHLTCRKRDIRLEFYEDATVYCIGELVMATNADRVEKFRKKLGELSQIMGIPVLKVSANLSDDILFLSTFMGMGIVDCKLLMF
ncbi:hypothetical protein POTOM_020010 [Populus tomentosa]|uniref:Uncharacterized protein n=1 Tax=Populus tomentosa TaxID=118781 RepID=A0A8X8D349_POPTO|nr:hypothetical protein POTOM_020010 [Populus tomentosa]